MTIEDLHRVLAGCAGDSDDTSWGEDVLDVDLDDLGYDSLARMETAARIEKEYGAYLPEERIPELHTHRARYSISLRTALGANSRTTLEHAGAYARPGHD